MCSERWGDHSCGPGLHGEAGLIEHSLEAASRSTWATPGSNRSGCGREIVECGSAAPERLRRAPRVVTLCTTTLAPLTALPAPTRVSANARTVLPSDTSVATMSLATSSSESTPAAEGLSPDCASALACMGDMRELPSRARAAVINSAITTTPISQANVVACDNINTLHACAPQHALCSGPSMHTHLMPLHACLHAPRSSHESAWS
jgi:hypothetical protein